VPYLFADLWRLLTAGSQEQISVVDTRRLPYRGYLVALGLVSIAGLFASFVQVQKVYALLGALFIPVLALALLILNGKEKWVGTRHVNRPLTSVILVATLVLFVVFGYLQIR
jgi:NADH:ubiquinone oxidoreductase subunit 6 (subunit J)